MRVLASGQGWLPAKVGDVSTKISTTFPLHTCDAGKQQGKILVSRCLLHIFGALRRLRWASFAVVLVLHIFQARGFLLLLHLTSIFSTLLPSPGHLRCSSTPVPLHQLKFLFPQHVFNVEVWGKEASLVEDEEVLVDGLQVHQLTIITGFIVPIRQNQQNSLLHLKVDSVPFTADLPQQKSPGWKQRFSSFL